MIIAGTGHRPNKLGGYGAEVMSRLKRCAILELSRIEPTLVISGMALGWDQALAKAAIHLKIPFHAYVPFAGQELKWSIHSQREYDDLLEKAHSVIYCSPGGYSPHKMQIRNERMVDACDLLLALWDGSPGGTANCIRYAQEVGKNIENCWHRYVEGKL